MDIQKIIAALREERDRLESAITALEGSGRRRGRWTGRRGRRRLSAAAKRRITQGVKQRWATRRLTAGPHGAGQGEP